MFIIKYYYLHALFKCYSRAPNRDRTGEIINIIIIIFPIYEHMLHLCTNGSKILFTPKVADFDITIFFLKLWIWSQHPIENQEILFAIIKWFWFWMRFKIKIIDISDDLKSKSLNIRWFEIKIMSISDYNELRTHQKI